MKKPSRRKRILLWAVVMPLLAVVLVIAGCNLAIVGSASNRTFDNTNDIPYNKVGLLLATSPYTPGGARNYYFENRIKAAAELFEAGKIKYIIASGGDYTKTQDYGYDEPKAIRDSLVVNGVPYNRIILDYDGTRTLNSIVKAKEAYGLNSVTVISQRDHNMRAINLADDVGLKTVAYNADPSPIFRNRLKNTLREYLARVKVFVDKIFSVKPSYPSDETVKKEIM